MSLFATTIGIDFGSQHTRIFLSNAGVIFEEKTIIAFDTHDSGNKKIFSFGNDAYQMLGRAPESISLVTPVERGIIVNQQDAIAFLNISLNSIKTFSLGKPAIVITVPTHITNIQLRTAYEVGRLVGASEVIPLQTQIAALFGSHIEGNEVHGRMIANIGAETTSVAIVSLGGMLSYTCAPLGGVDLDNALVAYIAQKHHIVIGRHTAEQIKLSYGCVVDDGSNEVISVKGIDTVTQLPKIIKLKKQEIALAYSNVLYEIIQIIGQVFRDTRAEIISDIIDYGILLSGGTSLLPGFDVLISEKIGTPAQVVDDPSRVVIRGVGKLISTGHIEAYTLAASGK
ncbi:MAG: rod shape-determining protein [Alphaproteobacteria bacterium]|nr:rod shape-determining protein [Alphaproteobacteria bacterium]